MYFVLFFLSISSKRGKKNSSTKVDPLATYNRDTTLFWKKKCRKMFYCLCSINQCRASLSLHFFKAFIITVWYYTRQNFMYENEEEEKEPCKN